MGKSKVTSLSPVMNGSTHDTWSKDGKTFWKFSIELEDGTKGQVLGANIQGPAYSIGDTVTFDLDNGKIKNVKKLKEERAFKSYYDDPKVQRNISTAVALRLAVKVCTHIDNSDSVKGDVYKVANKFLDEFYKGTPDNQELLNRRTSLEIAIDMMDLKWEEIDSSKDVFEEYYKILDWFSVKNNVGN